MNAKRCFLTVCVSVAAMWSAVTFAENNETTDSLPAVVRSAVETLFSGAVIEKNEVKNEPFDVYVVRLKSDGKEVVAKVAPDGTVVETKTVELIDALPAAVAQAIKSQDANAVSVEKTVEHARLKLVTLDNSMVTYEAKITRDGNEISVRIASDGKITGPQGELKENKEPVETKPEVKAAAAEEIKPAGEITTVNVGGTPLKIPCLANGFAEVGYDKREVLEVMVPVTNRLLCVFLKNEDIEKFGAEDMGMLSQYALLQVPRQAEFQDCGSSDFAEVVSAMSEEMQDIVSSSMGEVNAELSRRCEAIGVDEMQVGKPEMLGKLFSFPDAAAIAMLMSAKQGSQTIKMIGSCCLLRVKSRLLFAYVYAEYKDETTLKWINTTTETWAKEILKANR